MLKYIIILKLNNHVTKNYQVKYLNHTILVKSYILIGNRR